MNCALASASRRALLVLLLVSSGQGAAALAGTSAMLQVSARVVHACTIHVPARMPKAAAAHKMQGLARADCRGTRPLRIVSEPVRVEPVPGQDGLPQVRFTPDPNSRLVRITVTY